MAIECYDFAWGGVKHFPDGSYREQVKTLEGRTELSMIKLLSRVFSIHQKSISEYTKEDRQLLGRLIRARRPLSSVVPINLVIRGVWYGWK